MARTRYQRGDQADSGCTPGADFNKPLLSAETTGNETVAGVVAQGANINSNVEGAFIMASGDPGGGEDLAASSLFRCQLDVTVLDSQVTLRVVFHALNSSCTTQGSAAQAEGDIATTGLHTVTATWDPPVADRYAAYIHAGHSGMHTDPAENFTLRTNNANAFFEIPDAPAAGGARLLLIHPPGTDGGIGGDFL